MPVPLSAPEVLNREFLEIRARILQLAAAFDRLDRAEGSVAQDPRLEQIARALAAVAAEGPDRAAQVQRIFSRTYSPRWREEFGLAGKAE